jgi:hypothetical protein
VTRIFLVARQVTVAQRKETDLAPLFQLISDEVKIGLSLRAIVVIAGQDDNGPPSWSGFSIHIGGAESHRRVDP